MSLWNGKFHIVATIVDLYTHMIVSTNENEIANVPYVMILTHLDIVMLLIAKSNLLNDLLQCIGQQ